MPWPGFFDPADESLWAHGSDVDWIRGDWIARSETITATAARNPWLVTNRRVAESEIRRNRMQALAILGAILSWRVCTVSQLQAGLASLPVPAFTRIAPNLYGAMCRLGLINVGFSPAERIEGMMGEQAWLSMGNDAKLIRRHLDLIGDGRWLTPMLSGSGRLNAMRSHARHNTYAAHAGLTLAHDPRIRLTGGDGWGGFNRIDPQATGEAGLNLVSSTDVIALVGNGVLASLEVQGPSHRMETKTGNWMRLLAYSPMRRRGLLCVWLVIPSASGDTPRFDRLLDRLGATPEAMAGDPPTARRMGLAHWDDWYDHGHATDAFGTYTDLLGQSQSIFDPAWAGAAPQHHDVHALDRWGWAVMRTQIREHWGWDASGWSMPEAYRGGFYGFARRGGGADGR